MPSNGRQRIERVSPRRARLTPAPGTSSEPRKADETTDAPTDATSATAGHPVSGPNDERMRNDVPPHY